MLWEIRSENLSFHFNYSISFSNKSFNIYCYICIIFLLNFGSVHRNYYNIFRSSKILQKQNKFIPNFNNIKIAVKINCNIKPTKSGRLLRYKYAIIEGTTQIFISRTGTQILALRPYVANDSLMVGFLTYTHNTPEIVVWCSLIIYNMKVSRDVKWLIEPSKTWKRDSSKAWKAPKLYMSRARTFFVVLWILIFIMCAFSNRPGTINSTAIRDIFTILFWTCVIFLSFSIRLVRMVRDSDVTKIKFFGIAFYIILNENTYTKWFS